MEGLDYAQHLKKLPMYSIQRRNERFKIIYIYKIKENLVPNISNKYGLTFKINGRHGCKCEIPKLNIGSRARKARDNSFAWTACNLWNSLPKCVWDIIGKDVMYFKNKLDKVLTFYWMFPDLVGRATHMTQIFTSQIPCATTTET